MHIFKNKPWQSIQKEPALKQAVILKSSSSSSSAYEQFPQKKHEREKVLLTVQMIWINLLKSMGGEGDEA
jgi:hypothetical protein